MPTAMRMIGRKGFDSSHCRGGCALFSQPSSTIRVDYRPCFQSHHVRFQWSRNHLWGNSADFYFNGNNLRPCEEAIGEDNAKDFISSGGLRELQRISMESSRDDIRHLAKKMLKSNTVFQGQMVSS
ncbi:hypothetical protein V6N13_110866 [Hibiscus sabdariffa]|uniref:Uncharacterized protein n=1 Tax=Hibiscus sabdariffa TaxID=183260 RepID=A0ABR2TII2_9ROSI